MDHDELLFAASLTRVNHEIGRYAVRLLDEANGGGVTEYTVPVREAEYAVGRQMVELGEALIARAGASGLVVVEGVEFGIV